jgi:hypothetical protein
MGNRRFNVSEFSAEIGKRGTAKPSYFSVLLNMPPALRGFFDTSFLPLRIEHASLPSRSLMTIEQSYHGPVRNIPYRFMQQPMQLRIILSDNMIEREVLMAWQDLATSSGGRAGYRRGGSRSRGVGIFDSTFYDEIIGSVDILQFPETPQFQSEAATSVGEALALGDLGTIFTNTADVIDPFNVNIFGSTQSVKPQYRVNLQEAFPLNIGDVELDWSAGDQVSKLTVQMEYFIATEEHPKAAARKSLYVAEDFIRRSDFLAGFAPAISILTNTGVLGGTSGILDAVTQGIRQFRLPFAC